MNSVMHNFDRLSRRANLFSVCAGMLVAMQGLGHESLASSADNLRIAIPNKITKLDPVEAATAQEAFILPLVFENLFITDAQGEIKPVLVDKWTFDDKSSELILTLKSGHRFSDGSELRADEVVKSLQRMCKLGSRSASRINGLQGCGISASSVKVRAVDLKTVSLKILVHPSAFFYQLAGSSAVVAKVSEKGALLGSGPYKVQSLGGGDLVLTINPHFETQGGPSPSVQKMEFSYVPETELSGALAKGKFDIASMYLSSTAATIAHGHYKLIPHAYSLTQTLVLNPNRPPFNHLALRQALAEEIDDTAKLHECTQGLGQANGFLPAGIGGTMANRRAEKTSSTRAAPRPKLKAPVGSEVTLYRHMDRKNDCEEQRLSRAFSKFNIQLKMQYLSSYSELLPKYLDKQTDGYIELFVFQRDASTVLRRFVPGNQEPYFFYTQAQIGQELEQALQKAQLSERYELYRKINDEISTHSSVLPLYYVGHTNLIRQCIAGSRVAEAMSYNPSSFLFLTTFKKAVHCSGQ